jgi:3-oxoacyl-[acyl-carrier-protein] synthase-3
MTDTVGIVGIGTYSPKNILSSAEIAEATGYPEWVVRDKLGIHQKHVGGPDDQPNEMGIKAALDCLANSGIDPKEIDVVLNTTEEWREYLLWTSGIHMAYEIGATNAWAMDVHARCATTVGAMKMAKDMILADPEVNTVLIAGGYRVSDFINFKNPRTSFLWNIGSGGGAMLLRRNHPRNHVLGAHLMADGFIANMSLYRPAARPYSPIRKPWPIHKTSPKKISTSIWSSRKR